MLNVGVQEVQDLTVTTQEVALEVVEEHTRHPQSPSLQATHIPSLLAPEVPLRGQMVATPPLPPQPLLLLEAAEVQIKQPVLVREVPLLPQRVTLNMPEVTEDKD